MPSHPPKPADPASPAAQPIATTPYGQLRGHRTGAVLRFLGIPYAQPPQGSLRLRSPRPPQPWAGVRDATAPAAASLQTLGKQHQWLNEPLARPSEDCLGLNVWTPTLDADARLPVLLWLHGGQTRNGHGAAAAVDGTALAARGLVVVTINYRLGGLGGLAHPELEDEASGQCANWGLQDKLAALAWVQQAIAAFGGDPARVTLAGQSSGAANAALIAQHRLAPGSYSQLILQSPPLFRSPMFATLDEAAEYTEALAQELGTSVRGLRDIDGARLQQHEHALAGSPALLARMGRPRTAPVLDGRLLHAWSYDAPPPALPLLAGWTRHEADFWFDLRDGDGSVLSPLQPPRTAADLEARVGKLIAQHYAFAKAPTSQQAIEAYAGEAGGAAAPEQTWRDLYTDLVFRAPILHLLGRQARAGHAAWGYEFAYPLPNPTQGAPHASDVPFVFGTWRHPHFAKKIGQTPEVAALSEAMAQAWARFAATGEPAATAQWPAFDPSEPRVMRFGPTQAEPVALERPRGLAGWPAYAA